MSPYAKRELHDYNERERRRLFRQSPWQRFLKWLGL